MTEKPTVTYNGVTYKVRSGLVEIPDLDQLDSIAARTWLLRNTYPRGTNHRRPAPNIAGLKLEIR
jgi:hypothetical protein